MYFARFSLVSPFNSNTNTSVKRSNHLSQNTHVQTLAENFGGDQLILRRSTPAHGTLGFKGAAQIVVSIRGYTITFDPEKRHLEIFENASRTTKCYPLRKTTTTINQAEANVRREVSQVKEDLELTRQDLRHAELVAQQHLEKVPALREQIEEQGKRAQSNEDAIARLNRQMTIQRASHDTKKREANRCDEEATGAWNAYRESDYHALKRRVTRLDGEAADIARGIRSLERQVSDLEDKASSLRRSNRLIAERIERTERLDKEDITDLKEKKARLKEQLDEYQRVADLLKDANQTSSRQNLKTQAAQQVDVESLHKDFTSIEELMRRTKIDDAYDGATGYSPRNTFKSAMKASAWATSLPEFEAGPMEESPVNYHYHEQGWGHPNRRSTY